MVARMKILYGMRTLASSTYDEAFFVNRRALRKLAHTLPFALLLLRGGAAHAQSIQLGPDNEIERTVPYRETFDLPYWISYSDCVQDAVMRFPVRVTTTSLSLEVWAGSDNCAELRSSEDRKQCWLVRRITPTTDSFDVDIPVRNVVARLTESTDEPPPQPRAVCNASDDASGEAFTYYFMLVDGGQSKFSITWGGEGKAGFDVVGPAPPGNIGVGIGESRLSLRLDDVNEEADRVRFRAFCVPAGTFLADAGVGGSETPADTVGDAGVVGRQAPAECANGVLRSGTRAPIESEYTCGEASEVSTTIRTSPLANNVTYALAVAGEDKLGNTGVVSEIECGMPRVLDDFYERYTEAGGPGGGGFCSVVTPGASRVPLWSGLGWLGCALVLGARRGRRP